MWHRTATVGLVAIVVGGLIILLVTRCEVSRSFYDTPRAVGYASQIDMMECTKIISENYYEGREYSLEKSEHIARERSVDCELADKLIDEPSRMIKVVIRNISPAVFEGVRECDRVSSVPPAPDGSRQELSKQLVQMSFDSQVSVSLYALSMPGCFDRVFPSFRYDKNYSIENIDAQSRSFQNRDTDFLGAELPMRVVPVATLSRDGKLRAIACAQIVYNHSGENLHLDASSIYRACLSNFSHISAYGEQ